MQVLCLAACLAQCGLLLGSACSTLHTVRTARALQEIYRTAAPETADPLAPLKALNPDCAAWLEVDGTAVNLPVVLPEDNRTYLERDFSGEPSRSGTLFFDFRTDASTENPVIYGHNMRDGSMFGELDRFGEESFFTEHGLIRLTASKGVMWYRIFAAAVIPADAADPSFLDPMTFSGPLTEAETETMLEELHRRAGMWRTPHRTGGEHYLFLVTCDSGGDGRLLIAAQEFDREEE